MPTSKQRKRQQPTTVRLDNSGTPGRGLPVTLSTEELAKAWITSIHDLLYADGIMSMATVVKSEPVLAAKVTGIVSEVCANIAETPRLAAFRDVMRAIVGPEMLPVIDANRWIPENITAVARAMFGEPLAA